MANDNKRNDFFLKLRQSLGIDPKPLTATPKPKITPQKKQKHPSNSNISPSYSNQNNRHIINEQKSNGIVNKPNKNKLYISAQNIDYNLSSKELNLHKETYFNQCSRLLPLDQRTGDEALLQCHLI